MKTKRLLSVICVASIVLTSFAGLAVQAAEPTNAWETIYENDFSSGSTADLIDANGRGGYCEVVNGELLLKGAVWQKWRIDFNRSYSVDDYNVFKLTADIAVEPNAWFGIGIGDSDPAHGGYWAFGINTASPAQFGGGSGSYDSTYSYDLRDTNGTSGATVVDSWYHVVGYIELPSKRMTVSAYRPADPDKVVYRRTFTASRTPGDPDLGYGNPVDVSRIMINTQTAAGYGNYIDNLKLERLNTYATSSANGTLYYADFDLKGSTPSTVHGTDMSSVTPGAQYTDNCLSIASSGYRYSQRFEDDQYVANGSEAKVNMSFDVLFDNEEYSDTDLQGNPRTASGVGFGHYAVEDNGAFWMITYGNKGLVLGSCDDNEGTKIAYLTDSSDNRPTVERNKWYRVDCSIEFPSKLMKTTFYDRDAADPTKYSASMVAPEHGSNAVGGMWISGTADFNAINAVRYYTLSGMKIDNMVVTKTALPKYSISAGSATGGSVSAMSTAYEGQTVTVTATPTEGYELDYITVDGEKIDGDTFTMPGKDITVSAVFKAMASAAEDITAATEISGINDDGETYKVGLKFDEELNPKDYKYILFTVNGETKGNEIANISALSGIDGDVILAIILNNAPGRDVTATLTNNTVSFVE